VITRDNFLRLWNAFAKRRPWKPFTLELVSGSRLEVNHPESVTLGPELFIVRATSGVRNYLDYASVVRFIDATGVG
jgi:hypothetical protein